VPEPELAAAPVPDPPPQAPVESQSGAEAASATDAGPVQLVYEPTSPQQDQVAANRVSVARRVVYLQGFLLGAVALGFFVFGVIVGTRSTPSDAVVGGRGPFTVTGSVHYRDAQGQRQPDVGSLLCILPAGQQPEQQWRAEAWEHLQQEAAGAVDQAVTAELKALGGDWTRADAQGRYRLRVPAGGHYFLLVISRHAQREPDSSLKRRDLAEIGRYFLPPTALLDQQDYQWQKLLVRQDKQLVHSF
jgi:hypothetical protein